MTLVEALIALGGPAGTDRELPAKLVLETLERIGRRLSARGYAQPDVECAVQETARKILDGRARPWDAKWTERRATTYLGTMMERQVVSLYRLSDRNAPPAEPLSTNPTLPLSVPTTKDIDGLIREVVKRVACNRKEAWRAGMLLDLDAIARGVRSLEGVVRERCGTPSSPEELRRARNRFDQQVHRTFEAIDLELKKKQADGLDPLLIALVARFFDGLRPRESRKSK